MISLLGAVPKAEELGSNRFPPFDAGGVAHQGKSADPAGDENRAATTMISLDPERFGYDLMCAVHQRARDAR